MEEIKIFFNMKKFVFFLFALVLIFISTSGVIAPGPNFHLKIFTNLSMDPSVNNTLISQIINDNFDACLSGLEYPDVGIFEYYTNFKSYMQLHNYNVVDEMLKVARNDRDRAFAYCYKIHLATDGVSHNFFVPGAIKGTLLPNYIVHPIKELKIEGRYLDSRSNRMMENHKEFDWLVEKATGRDWSSEADKLNTIIGGGDFYNKAYTPDSVTFWGKFQNTFYWTLSKFISDKSEVNLWSLSLEESKSVLRGETPALDPSGEKALNSADQGTQLWLYLITFFIVIIIYILAWRFHLIRK